jgi:N-acetylglucosamine-6-phosphate deacetylase
MGHEGNRGAHLVETKVEGIDITTDRPCIVTLEQGIIRETVPTAFDPSLPYMSPGFIDIQVNGWQGIDYSGDGVEHNTLSTVVASLAATGTTRHLPTIISSPQERICTNLESMQSARTQETILRNAIPGFHIEGPYISEEDGPRGAHNIKYIRNPERSEFREWQAASDNLVRIVTIAPERPGAIDFIEYLKGEGVIPAIGHTAADPETITCAVQAGARLSTHLGNGSHSLLPRLRNNIWAQLASDQLVASIIGDGVHLPPYVLNVIQRAKGLDNIILVSDSSPIGGLSTGKHKWGDIDVEVTVEGTLRLAGTPYLAGAGHLLDWDIAHFKEACGISLQQAIQCCTVNPSTLLGLSPSIGEHQPEKSLKEEPKTSWLTPGSMANLTLFHLLRPPNAQDATRPGHLRPWHLRPHKAHKAHKAAAGKDRALESEPRGSTGSGERMQVNMTILGEYVFSAEKQPGSNPGG